MSAVQVWSDVVRAWFAARFGDRWAAFRTWLTPPPMPGPRPDADGLGPPKDLQRKEWVRRWFRPSPPLWAWSQSTRQMRWGVWTGLLAVCLLIAAPWGFAAVTGIIAVTLFLMGFVAWRTWHFAYAVSDEKPSPAHLDRTLDTDLRRIRTLALDRFRLSTADLAPGPAGRRGPVVLCGPAPDAKHRADDTPARVRRFTKYAVAVVCATPARLSVLTGTLTLDTGGFADVDTHEIRWDHVSALRSAVRPAKDLAAHEVVGFASRKPRFVVHELEVTGTDGAFVVVGEETSQPRPAELTVPVPLAEVQPWLSALVVHGSAGRPAGVVPDPAGDRFAEVGARIEGVVRESALAVAAHADEAAERVVSGLGGLGDRTDEAASRVSARIDAASAVNADRIVAAIDRLVPSPGPPEGLPPVPAQGGPEQESA